MPLITIDRFNEFIWRESFKFYLFSRLTVRVQLTIHFTLAYFRNILIEQRVSTFMRPWRSKFLFYKTRAQSQQIYS
jgi:hypothetical protein